MLDDFNVWFVRDNGDRFSIVQSNEEIGEIIEENLKINLHDKEIPENLIIDDFNKFKLRDEYNVGKVVKLDGVEIEVAVNEYETLIRGLLKIRALKSGKDPDNQEDYINKVINWIRASSFYDDPASTIYHENFPHGLLYHSLRVYNKMCELVTIPTFKDVNLASATLCCLVHDWCKIGLYEPYKRNVKNETTGRWEQKDAYRRSSFPHALGHGVASAYMAMKLFKLGEEEFAAIRWHMSMFNVASTEINEYQQACEQYPLIHLIQFADQLSIVEY